MNTFKRRKIYLRALEPEDLDFSLHCREQSIWHVRIQTPYSKFLINISKMRIMTFSEAKQLRLAICKK
jgi:diamine N-acetyltransferase